MPSLSAALPQRLLIATHNAGKLAELRALLQPYIEDISSAGEQGLPEPIEDGGSFKANALIKARAACKASGWPALADDSGLCITALNDRPGVDTANWTKRGLEGITELHEAMGSETDRSATCVCVLALVYPDGREELFEGRVSGAIVWPPRGPNGFGYDGIFRPEGEVRTYGEMDRDEKSALSHRGKALDQLLVYLRSRS
jgi:XTP/dITP diphosphohydrolase